jgi:hypothetical protein
MQRLTIRERLLLVALVPLLAFMLASGFWLAPAWSELAFAGARGWWALCFSAIAFAIVLALTMAHVLSRSAGHACEAIDAIVRAERDGTGEEAPLPRSEFHRVMAGIDQLAQILRERHRRDLVLIEVDRKGQANWRVPPIRAWK